ncbi:hypothetical protein [Aureimonas sp. D3]|uniref:hypothetical protein n=1 Tax=Aureimonas sp. D3 TaxID=1638164 RepID=UPI0012E356DA|nr:hypothetical protein [Aureimonas sp. D3]
MDETDWGLSVPCGPLPCRSLPQITAPVGVDLGQGVGERLNVLLKRLDLGQNPLTPDLGQFQVLLLGLLDLCDTAVEEVDLVDLIVDPGRAGPEHAGKGQAGDDRAEGLRVGHDTPALFYRHENPFALMSLQYGVGRSSERADLLHHEAQRTIQPSVSVMVRKGVCLDEEPLIQDFMGIWTEIHAGFALISSRFLLDKNRVGTESEPKKK